MGRPEFLNVPMTENMISRIRENQEHYDKDPQQAEYEARQYELQRQEQAQREQDEYEYQMQQCNMEE